MYNPRTEATLFIFEYLIEDVIAFKERSLKALCRKARIEIYTRFTRVKCVNTEREVHMNMKVRVLDAMMGSGKTTRLMEEVGKLPASSPVIYIAPLLSECHRFAGTVVDEEGNLTKGEDFLPV